MVFHMLFYSWWLKKPYGSFLLLAQKCWQEAHSPIFFTFFQFFRLCCRLWTCADSMRDATKPLQALCIQETDLNTSSKTCFELGCVLGFAHWAMVIPQSSWIHESLPRLKSFCWLALLKKVRQTVGPHLMIILTRVYKYTCMSELYIYIFARL